MLSIEFKAVNFRSINYEKNHNRHLSNVYVAVIFSTGQGHHIDNKWKTRVTKLNDDEESMLDLAFDVRDNSRLSCQIELSDELDGLELEIAPE